MFSRPRATADARPVVARVDHVYTRVADPKALFTFLTECLQLPRSYGFTRVPILEGGAVSLGNVVFLEVLRYAPGRRVRSPLSPGLDGLALEPAVPLAEAAGELSARGIPHSPPYSYSGDPQPFRFGLPLERAGLRSGSGRLWSMVAVGGLLGERRLARIRPLLPARGDSRAAVALGGAAGALMSSKRLGGFVMARSISRHPLVWLHEFHVADMRAATAAAREELRACSGGSLGVRGVREVVLAARDRSAENESWQRLLDPLRPEPDGAWQLGDGPALRLVDGEQEGIEALVLDVESLADAAAFVRRERLAATATDDELRLSAAPLQGLDLRLREARAVDGGG